MNNYEQKKQEYFEMYYDCINMMHSDEDIINNMPLASLLSYDTIMLQLIVRFNSDIKEYEELFKTENLTSIELSGLQKGMNKCLTTVELLKREFAKKKLADQKELLDDDSEKARDLIYLTSDNGLLLIEKDLKSIPEEYMDEIKGLLIRLKTGNPTGNPELHRKYANNNKIKNIHELKHFKSRVCYRNVGPDVAIVILANYKKADNDRVTRETIISRLKNYNDQIEKLKVMIENPIIKEQLIKEHQRLELELFEKIDALKRGGNNNDFEGKTI